MGKAMKVTGVITKGWFGGSHYTKTYKVSVSTDGFLWMWVECGRIFDGNNDYQTPVTNLFELPVEARYVRVYTITSSYGYGGGSFGMITCEAPCKREHLDYRY